MCETVGGPWPRQKCVFPFLFDGKEYDSCTTDGEVDYFWCATDVDKNGEMIIGNWGFCEERCAR